MARAAKAAVKTSPTTSDSRAESTTRSERKANSKMAATITNDATPAAVRKIKQRLRAATEELIERGGFGSPTMFVDGDDMYFGHDRLELLRHRLTS